METQNNTIWFSVIESIVWIVLDSSNTKSLTELINNSYELLSENMLFLDIDYSKVSENMMLFLDIDYSKVGYSIVVLKFFSVDLEDKEHYQAIYNVMETIDGWVFTDTKALTNVYPQEYWITTNILRPNEDDDETRKRNLEMLNKKLRLQGLIY